MDPLTLVVGLALVVVVAYLVGAPLLRAEPESPDLEPEWREEEELETRREAVFTTLGEIEFDYQMGKLSQGDYESLSREYKRQAVQVLQEEEKEMEGPVAPGGSIEAEIEKEIEAEIARELAQIRQQKG
ncbi:MAG: hypothetical protein D9V47_07370 [Clostridia bacterium]|nr:MAG: hypothetical protein D9V47_07370 [Clostridia bacterium]